MSAGQNKNRASTGDVIKNGSPVGPTASNMEPPKDKSPPPSEAPIENRVEETEQAPQPAKKKALDRLKERNKDSGMKKLLSKAERLELFDSTRAAELETEGTANRGTMKMEDGAFMVSGRNVGAEQNEPKWTKEQMDFIKNMSSTILPLENVNDSRRSVMDEEQKFVCRDEKGTLGPTENGYVSSLDTTEYCVGIGPYKYDITGSPKHYADAVIAGIRGDWMLNQWTSEWVVIEGVAPDVFMKQHRAGAATQSNRRIGINFARIGLPKLAFGPLLYTLSQNYPGVMSNVIETPGYYWMNASWGVSSFAATFLYVDKGEVKRTSQLAEVMRILNGKSSLALATVAISITCPSVREGDKQVPSKESFGLSVKLHNAFGVDIVDYHGPPQQGSTGMMIPKRFITGAKSMHMGSVGAAGAGIFAGANTGTRANLFGTGSQAAPSIKSGDSESFM